MTDEELIAWVRNGFGNVAADRIEALVKESAEMEAEAHAHIELWGAALREKAAAEARAERLEAGVREAIRVGTQPHYGDREDALAHYGEAMDVLRGLVASE